MAPAVAPQTWEEIVAAAQLSADESKLFEKVVQRVPEFRDGRLRQADYSRQSQELQKQKKDYDEAIAVKDRMNEWYETRKPTWDALLEAGAIDESGDPVWPDEKKRFAKELADAKAAALAGGDVDAAELNKRINEIVKANGGATQEEIKGLVAVEAKRMAEEAVDAKYKGFQAEFNTKTIPYVAGFGAAVALAGADFEKATGEEFDEEKTKALYELMNKENNMNPRAVMKIMLKPVFEKKATDAEVEKRATALAEKMLRERGELDENQPFIPMTEKDRAAQPKGSLQKLLELSSDGEGDTESAIRAAGSKAAAELRAAGK